MKKIIIGIVAAGMIFSCGTQKDSSGKATVDFKGFNSVSDSLSYFFGSSLTGNLKRMGIESMLNEGVLLKGFEDAKNGSDLLFSLQDGQTIARAIVTQAMADTTKKDKGSFTLGFDGLKNKYDSLSYFIGADMFSNLDQSGMGKQITKNAFTKGMVDAFNGDSLLVSESTGNTIANRIAQVESAKKYAVVKAEGEAFLIAKSAEKDVVTLPSGLRYKILKKGNGPIPKSGDNVKAHYHGTLMDGTVFDSSVDRGEPFQFNTESGVIQGWLEVSKLMPVGSKWEIYLPYNLAYGERGAGGKITPFATLIFQIEILEIVK